LRIPFRGSRSASDKLADRAFLIRTAILVGVIAVWDVSVRLGLMDERFLPLPGDVAAALVALLGDEEARAAFATTGNSILIAFVVGTTAGMAVAMVLGASDLLRRAYLSPLVFILSTPKSIFLPIFILAFGIGGASSAAFGAFEAFFYVVVNVLGGIGLVQERHLRVARAFNASRFHRYVDVIGPAALPGIFAALWYGVKHAFLGVMIAQLWASRGGIGDLIRTYSATLKTDYVMAIVLLITIVAVIAGSLWTKVEVNLNKWRSAGAGSVVGAVP
jgi:ABC-type nitrate/sulfonate/bicarbonate transport system permease component